MASTNKTEKAEDYDCSGSVANAGEIPEFVEQNQSTYSLKETRIGTHNNGKPLYRRGIAVSSVPVAGVIIPHGITNMDLSTASIIDKSRVTINNRLYPFTYLGGSAGAIIDLRAALSSVNVEIFNGGLTAVQGAAEVWFVYTKTTD